MSRLAATGAATQSACVCRVLPDAGDPGRDFLTDLLSLHGAFPARYPHLLESVAHGSAQARYDILFAFPGATVSLGADGALRRDGQAIGSGDFLTHFDALWAEEALAKVAAEEGMPFTGGWFVYLSYALAGQIEPRVAHAQCEDPIAFATRFPAAVVRDHARQLTYLVSEAHVADAFLPQIEHDLKVCRPTTSEPLSIRSIEEEAPAAFLSGVERVQQYIGAGDVFQVNLSRRWQVSLAAPTTASTVYARLRDANPAPFAGLATLPGASVISSSPERLVAVRDGRVRTRPIAGTYPRSADASQDAAWSRELLLHPKERAEHVMLIDLERNDLGRICETGSVQVTELMALESYRYVHHIVSEVSGRLRPGTTPGAVIRAVFPGGTITGCPKVRCMEIIAELEQGSRGAYTGSMGYINRDGSMDLNILIRTLTLRGQEIVFRAGAGIVADSVPARELAETRAKAKGLLMALHDAQTG